MTPRQYINRVRQREIYDPILTFQLSNGFHVKKVLRDYLAGDTESMEFRHPFGVEQYPTMRKSPNS